MAGSLKDCVLELHDNEENVRREAQHILLKLCNNILKYPKELSYRKIYLDNPLICNKLLPAAGAIECLFEVGFIENDDGFLLPLNTSLAGVKELCSLLSNLSADAQNPSTSTEKSIEKEHIYKKKGFFIQLERFFRAVLRYEDQNLQNKVKLILPLEKLQFAAMKKLREVQRTIKIENIQDDTVFEDMLLVELLSWFKLKFFKWVNSPACKNCMGECSYDREIISPDPQISRIEIHRCSSCECENEFPRYTDPEALLYTRQGRCGEWANCFTLICRTVGFDARLVYDETDHVWTEVWSVAHNRWIHADACENAMDRPLIYEKGWGKELTYIIAFSKDEIQDVTWRYTRNYDEVIKRRNICTEESLTLFVNKLNLARQNSEGYSKVRKKFILKRSVLELAEMINAPPGCKKPGEELINESDYSGRTSGSLAWRISRGEIRDISYKAFQWNIPKGISSFEFTYSIISDSYITRDIINDKILETKEKWQSGIELLEGEIFRKVEEDWKMVYLARTPQSLSAKITWSFSVEDSANMSIDSIKLQAIAETFNGAMIKWEVEGIMHSNDEIKEENKIVPIPNSKNFETNELRGAIKIRVSAVLSGGEGKIAWQHAQLFRQSSNANSKEPSMTIKIDLLNRF